MLEAEFVWYISVYRHLHTLFPYVWIQSLSYVTGTFTYNKSHNQDITKVLSMKKKAFEKGTWLYKKKKKKCTTHVKEKPWKKNKMWQCTENHIYRAVLCHFSLEVYGSKKKKKHKHTARLNLQRVCDCCSENSQICILEYWCRLSSLRIPACQTEDNGRSLKMMIK